MNMTPEHQIISVYPGSHKGFQLKFLSTDVMGEIGRKVMRKNVEMRVKTQDHDA
jgi:hypothetical protein